MNVALILDYSKDRRTGGPEGVAYDTVEGLKKNHERLENEDIHIHIMSSLGKQTRSSMETEEEYGNINYEFFKKMVPSALLSDLNYFYRMKKSREKIDLVHSHPPSGAVAGCLLHLPSVLTIHGMYWRERNFLSDPYSRFGMEMNNARVRYVAPRLAKLIAISPYVIDEIEDHLKMDSINTAVIENPISDLFFSVNKEEVEGLLIYPGRIIIRKNHVSLVKAMNLIKKDNIKFHCVLPGSSGDDESLVELRRMIKKSGLENDITIPGVIPFSDLLELYSQASIMVMTSLQETAPMVISEAMATGTPVIASRISGIPYMVSQGESGFLIDPKSPEEIAKFTAILLDDDVLRRRMQKEARRIADSRWRNDLIIGKQLDEYRNAAAALPSSS